MNVNWCTSCKVVLANEEVVGGVCERCGGEVVHRAKSQWMLKITAYADRLVDDLDTVDYIERVKTAAAQLDRPLLRRGDRFRHHRRRRAARVHHPRGHASSARPIWSLRPSIRWWRSGAAG